MSELPESVIADGKARRPTRRLFWISLLCIIAIWFVSDFLFFRSLSPPAAVTAIAQKDTVFVMALSPIPRPLCLIVSPGWWPVRVQCDWQVRRVHLFELNEFSSNRTWYITLGFLLRWWGSGVTPIAGLLADPSLPLVSFPPIQMISNKISSDTDFLSLPGTVVAQDGQPEGDAVAILQTPDGRRAVTRADRDGNFTLRIDRSWMSAEAELVVWGENGYVRVPQPIEILVDVPQVIQLQPYAKN